MFEFIISIIHYIISLLLIVYEKYSNFILLGFPYAPILIVGKEIFFLLLNSNFIIIFTITLQL